MPTPTVRPPVRRDGLVLRALAPGDADRLLEIYTDPDELRWGLPVGVPLPEDRGAVLARVEESAIAWSDRAPGNVAVADAVVPDHLLGVVSWRLDQPVLRIADVGYVVHADARGRGVATRGLRLLAEWLTGTLPTADADGDDAEQDSPRLPRVQLDHSVENPASCAVALRAGFAREGMRRSYLPLRDPEAPDGVRRHDVCLHGLVV
jgi:RimJ/RimL family protein N-acetyltransferase